MAMHMYVHMFIVACVPTVFCLSKEARIHTRVIIDGPV